jgi:hypothetical protein
MRLLQIRLIGALNPPKTMMAFVFSCVIRTYVLYLVRYVLEQPITTPHPWFVAGHTREILPDSLLNPSKTG